MKLIRFKLHFITLISDKDRTVTILQRIKVGAGRYLVFQLVLVVDDVDVPVGLVGVDQAAHEHGLEEEGPQFPLAPALGHVASGAMGAAVALVLAAHRIGVGAAPERAPLQGAAGLTGSAFLLGIDTFATNIIVVVLDFLDEVLLGRRTPWVSKRLTIMLKQNMDKYKQRALYI